MESLGDRMKRYEAVTNNILIASMPLAIRVDGKAFHTYAKGFDYPFSNALMGAMESAAYDCAYNMQGFKAAYVQSDEVTFVLADNERHETQGWFNYEHQKIVSLSSSLMTAFFNKYIREYSLETKEFGGLRDKLAFFDSRAFNIPFDDVSNLFLWRAKDWNRNSLQMYSRSFFSHKECHKKNAKDLHEMLYNIGKNWTTDLTDKQKNGTFIFNFQKDKNENKSSSMKILYNVFPDYNQINGYILPLLKPLEKNES